MQKRREIKTNVVQYLNVFSNITRLLGISCVQKKKNTVKNIFKPMVFLFSYICLTMREFF